MPTTTADPIDRDARPRGRPLARLVAAVGLPSVLAVLYVVAHLLWLALQPPGARWGLYVSDAFFFPTFLATGVLAWRTSRLFRAIGAAEPGDADARSYESAWWLLSVAYLVLWLANVAWAFYDVFAPAVLAPEPVRWLTLVSYLPLVAGLLRFPMRERGRRTKVRLALDLATVGSGAGLLIWYVLLRPLAASSDWRSLVGLLHFIPPLGDLTVVTLVASLLLQRTHEGGRRWLTLLALGHIFSVGAGVAAGYVAINGGYQPGSHVDAAWMLSDLFVFLGIELARRRAKAALERGAARRGAAVTIAAAWETSAAPDTAVDLPSRLSLWLPYLFVALAFAVLIDTSRRDADPALRVALWGNALVLLLVGVRQLVAFRENARLALATARQESRFHALVQYASDVVTVIDATGVVVYQSPAVERLLGVPADELTGSQLADLMHPDEESRYARHLRAIAAADRPSPRASGRPSIWRLRHRDGRWITVETLGTALLDDPAVRGVVLNTRDVTDRLALEEQLRRAQKMEAVGRLAAGIAHDFNNLLTIVRCNAAIVRGEWRAPDAAGRELVEIEDAVDRATALTRQLLAFSRQQIVQPATLDVAALVRGLAPLIGRLLGSSVELRVGADVAAWVHADAGQLEQVVMNLAVNARDAMPQGGTLTIEVDAIDVDATLDANGPATSVAAGEYVRLVVTDSGCGMDESTRAQLFDPFFTTKPAGQGTGLGLSTVLGIVSDGGGHVVVRSAPGEGAAFSVYVRRVAAPAAVEAPATVAPPVDATADDAESSAASANTAVAAPVAPRPTLAMARRGETVLVADDEDAVRGALSRLLVRCGYVVLTARDGIEALAIEAAHTGAIDLLLTDMVMPRLGGRELADEFLRRRPGARVIYMSGYTEDETLRTGVLAHESAFLGKPFSVVAAAALISDVLDRSLDPV